MESYSDSYKAAGVDVTAGYRAVELMKKHVAKTMTENVISGLGGFGGLFELDITDIKKPVLVSGTDGVGTKLKLAFLLDRHNTIGIDCVAMCVNDIICCGAKPLFFLDYIAMGKNYPEKVASIVEGVADGCIEAACSLVGGESAEMPGFYDLDEYDIAGFSVGVVDKDKIIDHNTQKEGDIIIALPSSGVHSNGFSLVRKVFDISENTPKDLLTELLTPTKIYVKAILNLIKAVNVKGITHITGGGFYENIPRGLKLGLAASINQADIKILPIFDKIQSVGNIGTKDMFNTFNMGVGMTVIVDKNDVDMALNVLLKNGENAYIIGKLINGNGEVIIKE